MNFEPSKGMIWQWPPDSNPFKTREKLPIGQQYYLDLEALLFVYERNKLLHPNKKGWEPGDIPWWNWKERGLNLKFFCMEVVLHPKSMRPIFKPKTIK